jgi:hypothetical protein
VPESGVDNAVRLCGSAAQAFKVFEIAAVRLGAGSGKRFGARLAARKAEHLVAGVDQLSDDI